MQGVEQKSYKIVKSPVINSENGLQTIWLLIHVLICNRSWLEMNIFYRISFVMNNKLQTITIKRLIKVTQPRPTKKKNT